MKIRNSMAAKFTVLLVLVLVLGQGAGVYLFLRHTHATLLEALHDRVDRQVRQSAAILTEPLLNYNFPVIDAYLSEILLDPDIVAVQVVDRDGNLVRAQGEEGTGAFAIYSAMHTGESPLGDVHLEYTAHTVQEWLDRNLVLIPLFQFLLLTAVAAFLILMVRLYIRRPVARLNQVLARITAGDLTTDFPPFARDDIGTLADGIRFLADHLAATIARIHSISANASTTVSALHQTSERVTGVVHRQERSIGEVVEAVKSASESQRRIVAAAEELLSQSGDNSSALLQMRASAEEIAGSAESLRANLDGSHAALAQLAQAARQVNRMTEEVGHSVEASAASVEEIFASVKEIGATVRESAQLSSHTSAAIADKGMTAVRESTEGMRRIGSFMKALAVAIEGMGTRSQDVGRVLAVIGEVTEQLQLLSLNAQIIAAQAGQSGQGFAVVAHEMRELSSRTGDSTREIAQIVAGIQAEIMGVVKGAREMEEIVRTSDQIVHQTGEVFDAIRHSSEKAAGLAQRIEYASAEQTKGLEAIVGATERIRNGIAEVNSATNEQEKSSVLLVETLGKIREAMGLTQSATQEQTRNLQFLAGNMTVANDRTSAITEASLSQEAVNQQILDATQELLQMAGETAVQVNGHAGHLCAIQEEIGLLQQQLQQFRIAVR